MSPSIDPATLRVSAIKMPFAESSRPDPISGAKGLTSKESTPPFSLKIENSTESRLTLMSPAPLRLETAVPHPAIQSLVTDALVDMADLFHVILSESASPHLTHPDTALVLAQLAHSLLDDAGTAPPMAHAQPIARAQRGESQATPSEAQDFGLATPLVPELLAGGDFSMGDFSMGGFDLDLAPATSLPTVAVTIPAPTDFPEAGIVSSTAAPPLEATPPAPQVANLVDQTLIGLPITEVTYRAVGDVFSHGAHLPNREFSLSHNDRPLFLFSLLPVGQQAQFIIFAQALGYARTMATEESESDEEDEEEEEQDSEAGEHLTTRPSLPGKKQLSGFLKKILQNFKHSLPRELPA